MKICQRKASATVVGVSSAANRPASSPVRNRRLLGGLDERDVVQVGRAEAVGAAGRSGPAAAALVAHLQLGLEHGADQHEPVHQQRPGDQRHRGTVGVGDLPPGRVGDVHHVLVVGEELLRRGPRGRVRVRVGHRVPGRHERIRVRVGDRLAQHVDEAAVGEHLEGRRGAQPGGRGQERIAPAAGQRHRGQLGLVGDAEADLGQLGREAQLHRIGQPRVHVQRTRGVGEVEHAVVDPPALVHREREDGAVVAEHRREPVGPVLIGLDERVEHDSPFPWEDDARGHGRRTQFRAAPLGTHRLSPAGRRAVTRTRH